MWGWLYMLLMVPRRQHGLLVKKTPSPFTQNRRTPPPPPFPWSQKTGGLALTPIASQHNLYARTPPAPARLSLTQVMAHVHIGVVVQSLHFASWVRMMLSRTMYCQLAAYSFQECFDAPHGTIGSGTRVKIFPKVVKTPQRLGAKESVCSACYFHCDFPIINPKVHQYPMNPRDGKCDDGCVVSSTTGSKGICKDVN